MKKEIYLVKCPKHIRFGDPMYFECFEGEKLSRLVVDFEPPENFEARVVLEENGIEDSRMIGVDMASYLLNIDEKGEEISTDADDYWGGSVSFLQQELKK